MKIQIVNQINEQECGVCALTSLHNYYYKEDQLKKEQVLDKSQIDNTGMAIIDFEVLGNKLGLECESYEIQWAEFLNLHINNYFVLLLSTASTSNHYVVAKKIKRGIEIFDSCSSEKKILSFDKIKTMFTGIIILVNKQPGKLFDKTFGKASTLLLFDAKFVIFNLLLSLLILLTSIGCASFLNWIIDLAISKSSINNLLTISFTFLLVYFLNDLMSYISGLYTSSQSRNYLVLFTNKILSCIGNKKSDFLFKVDQNWIYKIDECIYNLATFCVVEVNKFITNIIFSIICICIIGSINYWLLIFCVLFGGIEVIFFVFRYRKKKEVFLSIIRSENKNTIFYKQLIKSLSSEVWETKKKNLIQRIKNNYGSIYKNFNDVTLFRSNNNLIKSLFKGLMEVALVVTMGYLVISTKTLSIGNLTFVVSAFGLYRASINDICDYFLAKQEFDVYWQVYKDLTTVSNLNEKHSFQFDLDVKTITFFLENEKVLLSTNKNNKGIHFSAIDLLSKSSFIQINDKKFDMNKEETMNRLVLLDEKSNVNIPLFLQILENNPILFSQYIRYFQLDVNKQEQSFYDCLVINLLTLLNEENKIILIDNLMQYIKKKDKIVVKEIINKIQKNNAVFIMGKEEND